MKKVLLILILAFSVVWLGCELKTPETPKLNLTQGQLALNKIVAVGNSLTAGYQSAGLRRDFQEHSYPYLIVQQMGKATAGNDCRRPQSPGFHADYPGANPALQCLAPASLRQPGRSGC